MNLLWAFCFLFILLLVNLKRKTSRKTSIAGICSSVMFALFLVLSLHMRLTPVNLPDYFLNIPQHQCIFCLLGSSTVLLVAFILAWAGASMSLACHTVALAIPNEDDSAQLFSLLRNHLRLSLFPLIPGTLILAITLYCFT